MLFSVIFYLSFLPCLRSPAHFLHGSVILLFLQWIGFRLLSQAWRLLPWFLPSLRNSLPLSLLITLCPSLSPPPHSLPLSLREQSWCVCVIPILCSLIGRLRTSNIMETISVTTRAAFSSSSLPFHFFPSLLPAHLSFSILCFCLTLFHLNHTCCSQSKNCGTICKTAVRQECQCYVPWIHQQWPWASL